MTTPTHEGRTAPGPLAGAATDVARCLRFYSRLPVPALPWEDDPHARPDFTRMTAVLPIAGAIIGSVGALALLAAGAVGLPPLPAAALAVAALALATGAFHEDGLADVFDAFGGGATPERRLEILRDSRIGAFGGAALALALLLRASLLAGLVEAAGLAAAAGAVVAVAALSRTAGLVPLTLAPPARVDGASAAVGRPAPATLARAGALAAVLSLGVAAAAGLSLVGTAAALAGAAAAGYAFTRWSMRMIGGQNGDVAGAAQQAAEIVALACLLIAAGR